MRVLLTMSCLAACLLSTTTGWAQNLPGAALSPSQPAMADCHPSSFGKLVDVTTVDGKTWQASIHCLDPQHVQLLRDGVVTSTPLSEVRRIVTRPDPVWDGFVKGAAIPLILTAILCFDCLDEGFTYRGALAYGVLGATWDALQSNRKTIFDSGGRPSGVTASVSVPLRSLVGWAGVGGGGGKALTARGLTRCSKVELGVGGWELGVDPRYHAPVTLSLSRCSRAISVGVLIVVLLASVGAAPVAAQDAAAGRVMTAVTAIAAGDDNGARREAIVAALRTAGVEPALEPFGSEPRAGVNIVATLPGSDARTILVGAHYDRVAVGRGAVDNGAACAALIELIRRFKASPLARSTLAFVFFDREENGLVGSREYFAAHSARPAFGVNLDIFAYGDTVFATAGNADSVLLRSLKAAGEAAGVPVRDVPLASYPGSDHRSMITAGIDTLGLAIVDAADVEAILNLGVAGLKPGQAPRILTLIHTPNDTLAEVKPDQMVRGIAVVEGLLRALDRQ